MMPRPFSGHSKRVTLLRAALPCLAVIAVASPVKAQILTSDLLRPIRDGYLTPQDSFLRKTSDNRTGDTAADPTGDPVADAQRRKKTPPAPSRIGAIPKYGLPAVNGNPHPPVQ